MSLKAVEQVKANEKINQERRTAAEQQAKQQIAQAQQDGLALLKKSQELVEEAGKKLLQKAEENAKRRSDEIAAETERQSGRLRREAESHLEQAAERIVEKIVR